MPPRWSSRTGSDEIARYTRHFLSTDVLGLQTVLIQSVPRYVPAARELALTLAVMVSGVVQHPLPEFATVSHAPPLPVATIESKVTFFPELSPVLISERI